jgi:uncharacterized protein (TIGR02284 family)
MDEKVKKLISLTQLDIDAVYGYVQALKEVDDQAIRSQLTAFRDDHKRHADELSHAIVSFGENPPEFSPDFKGYITAGFTAVRSLSGTIGALKALESNEKLSNRAYSEALSWDMPVNVKGLIEKNYADERRHLKYIQDRIEAVVAARW